MKVKLIKKLGSFFIKIKVNDNGFKVLSTTKNKRIKIARKKYKNKTVDSISIVENKEV